MNNKISIIVPVYNSEKYLNKCLDSLVKQSYKNIEIIIVNDGSTDKSFEIINNYLNENPEIIKHYIIDHSGVATARNYGISKVTGEYFIFVDSDDYINFDLIASLNTYLSANPNIDLVKYKMQVMSNEKAEKITGPVFDITSGENAFNKLCFLDVLIDTPCLYLINTNFFRTYNFSFLPNSYHEDFGLMPLLIISAKSVASLDIYGYNYFKSDNSIMRNSDYQKTLKKAEDLFLHYDNMIKYIKSISLNKITEDNIKQYYRNDILLSMKRVKANEKKQLIVKFKNKKLIKNIKPKNLKQFIKKTIIFFNINLYLKIL